MTKVMLLLKTNVDISLKSVVATEWTRNMTYIDQKCSLWSGAEWARGFAQLSILNVGMFDRQKEESSW